jgi:hypothetical protein
VVSAAGGGGGGGGGELPLPPPQAETNNEVITAMTENLRPDARFIEISPS